MNTNTLTMVTTTIPTTSNAHYSNSGFYVNFSMNPEDHPSSLKEDKEQQKCDLNHAIQNNPVTMSKTQNKASSLKTAKKRKTDSNLDNHPLNQEGVFMKPKKVKKTKTDTTLTTTSTSSGKVEKILDQCPDEDVITEKERLRRVSHSAIEKRRRERINEKINLLRQIVPNCHQDESMHKLTVLEHTIDYIHELHEKLMSFYISNNNSSTTPEISSDPHPIHPNLADPDHFQNQQVNEDDHLVQCYGTTHNSSHHTTSQNSTPLSLSPSSSPCSQNFDHHLLVNRKHNSDKSYPSPTPSFYRTDLTNRTTLSSEMNSSQYNQQDNCHIHRNPNTHDALLLLSEQACHQRHFHQRTISSSSLPLSQPTLKTLKRTMSVENLII